MTTQSSCWGSQLLPGLWLDIGEKSLPGVYHEEKAKWKTMESLQNLGKLIFSNGDFPCGSWLHCQFANVDCYFDLAKNLDAQWPNHPIIGCSDLLKTTFPSTTTRHSWNCLGTGCWTKNRGGVYPPKWMVNIMIMENPMNKWMILGVFPWFLGWRPTTCGGRSLFWFIRADDFLDVQVQCDYGSRFGEKPKRQNG